ncbi:MAG: hypothetical protein JWM14_2415 [Chitinophagaceae bacterium]|nr:hypothetical protein [Chitinophagaceae bacterium]
MIKNLIFCFCLLFVFTAQAQEGVTKTELVGTWRIVKMEVVKEGNAFVTIDEASGAVFSEEFSSALKEDELKLMKDLMNAAGKKVLNSKIIYTTGGDYTQVDTEGKKFSGKYKLAKGGKLLKTTSEKEKNEYVPSITNKQLVLVQTLKNGDMVLTFERVK